MRNLKTNVSVGAGFLLALPFTVALAGLAVAHPGGAEGPRPPTKATQVKLQKCRAAHHAEKLAALDTDKDGKISEDERRHGHRARKAARLAEFDKDNSGDLSASERKDARHAKMVETFEALDTNADAEIRKEEAEASCAPIGRHFDRVDADGNGSVTWTEFEAAVKNHIKRGRRDRKGHPRPPGCDRMTNHPPGPR